MKNTASTPSSYLTVQELAESLTARDIGILLLSPYENPHAWTKGDVAHVLPKGLLEAEPTKGHVFRVTEKGIAVLDYLLSKHTR